MSTDCANIDSGCVYFPEAEGNYVRCIGRAHFPKGGSWRAMLKIASVSLYARRSAISTWFTLWLISLAAGIRLGETWPGHRRLLGPNNGLDDVACILQGPRPGHDATSFARKRFPLRGILQIRSPP